MRACGRAARCVDATCNVQLWTRRAATCSCGRGAQLHLAAHHDQGKAELSTRQGVHGVSIDSPRPASI
eukprot:365709-Chlamydomonas_euryale.AAC.2